MSDSPAGKCLFIFGGGYTALHFARKMLNQGWQVRATCRHEEKLPLLESEGISGFILRRDAPLAKPEEAFRNVTHMLHSIPTDPRGDLVHDLHGPDLINLFNDKQDSYLEWFGYLSTTGVYGNHDGGWVDENTPPNPSHPRTERRVAAEQAWLDLARQHGFPAHVFRLAGIYGPGRSPLEKMASGTARRIDKPGQVFSRIHVEDIAGVLQASIRTPAPGEIYNVCDDLPEEPHRVIEYAAALLEMNPPPLVSVDSPEVSEMARSFYADNRRVRNDKLRTALGYSLEFPTYKPGLEAILRANKFTFSHQ